MDSARGMAVSIWEKSLRTRTWLDAVWKSAGTGAVLLLVYWGVAIRWLLSTPSPGKAVLVLAVVATVMTFRGELSGLEKTFLTLVLFVFVFIEITAIDKDRADSTAQALRDRNAQDVAFQGVRTTQDADFKATAGGLQAAIDGIKSTLETANTTLRQTQPHAALHLDGIEFSPSAPSAISANTPYFWNYHYRNSGMATATDLTEMQEVYVADADSKDAEIELVDQFNKEWKVGRNETHAVIVPNVPMFGSITKTFSDEEMRDFGKKTLYFLFRFEYSDGTGRWGMDECESLQRANGEIYVLVYHPCEVFINARYQVKRQ